MCQWITHILQFHGCILTFEYAAVETLLGVDPTTQRELGTTHHTHREATLWQLWSHQFRGGVGKDMEQHLGLGCFQTIGIETYPDNGCGAASHRIAQAA